VAVAREAPVQRGGYRLISPTRKVEVQALSSMHVADVSRRGQSQELFLAVNDRSRPGGPLAHAGAPRYHPPRKGPMLGTLIHRRDWEPERLRPIAPVGA
jgi:hypothetical protein